MEMVKFDECFNNLIIILSLLFFKFIYGLSRLYHIYLNKKGTEEDMQFDKPRRIHDNISKSYPMAQTVPFG